MEKNLIFTVFILIIGSTCHGQETNDLECYTCVYIQSHINRTNQGCDADRPPAEYKRKDCFGFGDLQAAGGIRHSTNASSLNEPPKNVHCVKITGYIDSDLVILRGCESLYFYPNETVDGKQCSTKREYDFPLIGVGVVRNVERCYCEGNACNGSRNLVGSAILTLLSLYFLLVKAKINAFTA